MAKYSTKMKWSGRAPLTSLRVVMGEVKAGPVLVCREQGLLVKVGGLSLPELAEEPCPTIQENLRPLHIPALDHLP